MVLHSMYRLEIQPSVEYCDDSFENNNAEPILGQGGAICAMVPGSIQTLLEKL